MARKGKTDKYRELALMPNVIQNPVFPGPGGKREFWDPTRVPARGGLFLEPGCGRGEYTLGLARLHPENFYIGIDLKGARMWHGAARALEEGTDNALFLRMRAQDLADYFPACSIEGIWLTFPDPRPADNARCARKRFTSPDFIGIYRKILRPGAPVHLKTDSPELYGYTKKIIKKMDLALLDDRPDLYNSGPLPDDLRIRTAFEIKQASAGGTIRYLCFRVD